MIDLLKKTVLAGIGAAVVTKETVEKQLSELVAKGKITAQEAGVVADKVVEEGRKEYESTKSELARFIEETVHKLQGANKKDLEALELRVKSLEAALAAQQAEEPEKATV